MVRSLCAAALPLFMACASGENIPPPGGPPDETPPVIEGTEPVDGTINFSGKSVRIRFNEAINESGASQQIVITPIPERTPEFDWGRKDVEITFRDPLVENRTYAITVGAGIQDASGNRLGTPVTLRFATGPVIDSGRIAGQVTGAGSRNTFIFAYILPADGTENFGDTLQPADTPPDFIAPVGDNGQYSMEGLPPGTYRLFAVADEFNDRQYSPGTDAYGVASRDVSIASDYTPVYGIKIRMLPGPLDLDAPQLFSASAVNSSRTELRFSEPIDTGTLSLTNFALSAGGNTATLEQVWRSPENPLTVLLSHSPLSPETEAIIQVSNLKDTIGLTIPDSARTDTFRTTARRDTLAPQLRTGKELDKGYRLSDTLAFWFDEAVQINEASAAITLTDTASGASTQFRIIRRSPAAFVALPIDTTFDGLTTILSINLAGFPDLNGNRTDTVWQRPLQIKPIPQRGTLQGTLKDSLAPDVPHVILLESAEDRWSFAVRLKGTGAWELKDIPSGNYNLSAFRDVNNDGEYDYGSLSPYRPGEVFVIRQGGIRVRPRWTTTEVDIDF